MVEHFHSAPLPRQNYLLLHAEHLFYVGGDPVVEHVHSAPLPGQNCTQAHQENIQHLTSHEKKVKHFELYLFFVQFLLFKIWLITSGFKKHSTMNW